MAMALFYYLNPLQIINNTSERGRKLAIEGISAIFTSRTWSANRIAASNVFTPSSFAKSTSDCLSNIFIVKSSILVGDGNKDSSIESQPFGWSGNGRGDEKEEEEEEEHEATLKRWHSKLKVLLDIKDEENNRRYKFVILPSVHFISVGPSRIDDSIYVWK